MKAIRWWVLGAAVFCGNANLQAQLVPPQAGPTQAPPQNGGPAYAGEAPLMVDGPGYAEGGYMPQGGNGPDMGYGGYCGDDCCNECGGLCDALHDWFHTSRVFGCCGRGYFAVEALMLARSDNPDLPLATLGTLGSPAGPVVLSANDPYFHLETMPRIIAGYVLPNDTAIEGTYFYKDDIDASKGVSTTLPNSLFVPDPTGTIDQLFGNTFIHVNQATGIQNVELNLVETGRTFNFIAGLRWLEIQDRMILRGDFVGTDTFVLDTETYNTMYGGQGGMRTGFDCGLFHFEGQGKAGMFFNNGSAETRYSEIPFAATSGTSGDGECESFVGELSCMMTYRVAAKVALRAGYQVIWICNTAIAVDQINPLDPTNSGGVFYFSDRGDITLHGPSAGIDVRF